VYALEDWLADLLGTQLELPVLALIFVVGLGLLPILLMGLAGWVSRWWAGATGRSSLRAWVTRYAYALVPLGFGVWLAHYAFHFLTGFWTFVPVVQSFAFDIFGTPLFGMPRWDLGPLLPAEWLYPLELGFLGLGWLGSLLVAFRLAAAEEAASEGDRSQSWQVFLPWAALLTFLFAVAIWLMGQPMEMRGTFLVG
jgi:hypothetical protein